MIARKINTAFHLLRPRRVLGALWGPRVLLVSVPKAGTNMLRGALDLFPQLRFGGRVVRSPSQHQEILGKISNIKRGQFMSTHLRWSPEAESIFIEADIKGLFMIRDPRDVAVSHYHYIMREPGHWCYAYFHNVLEDESSRLTAVIMGLGGQTGNQSPVRLHSIDEHFRCRTGYLEQSRFLTIRFEELVGTAGAGTNERQETTIRTISNHLNLRLTDRDIHYIAANVYSKKSPTFRKGKTGSWRQELTGKRKEAFKEIAGQLLIDLGYESNLDW